MSEARRPRSRGLAVVAVVSALAVAHPAQGQDGASTSDGASALRAARSTPDALTLDEAMRLALGQSPALAGKFVDVDIAGAQVLQASGLDDFSVNGAGSLTHSRGANTPAQSTPLLPYDSVDLGASLTRPLSTGGTVSLKLDAPYVRMASSASPGGPGDTGPIEGYMPSAQLSLTQPLLRGRGYDVARAPVRQARAARDVAGWELEASASALLRDVSFAYWELAYAAGDFALRTASLDAARAQLRATQAQIEVGKLPPSASAEVEVSIALREDEAVDSESSVPERAADLARLLGVPPAGAMRSLRATERPPLRPPADPGLLERALERNAEIASLHAQARATTIGLDVARSGLLPQLDVFASGGPMGAATEPAPALRMLGTFGAYTVQGGFVFQEPIERRAQRGARDAASGVSHKARLTEEEARIRVASELSIASSGLEATRRRVELLAHAVQVADLDLAGEEARFQANRSTNFDVLRRQQASTDVRLRLLRAQIDHARAAAALDALTGDLLPHHGLALRAERGAP